MTVDNGRPLIGPTARALGVRVPDDILVNEGKMVQPGTGGMSVSPTWPRRARTHNAARELRCWT